MDLAEALRRRRMFRHFSGAAVAPDALDRIVAAGLSAPTAGGTQGTALVTITDPGRIAAVAAACGEADWVSRGFDPWLSTAGAHLVVCVEPEVYRERYSLPDKDPGVLETVPWWWVDGGAALMAILLATVAEGLGAGFQGGHRAAAVRPLLGIPDAVVVVGIVTIGHPVPPHRARSRRHRARRGRVHRETW